MRPKWCPVQPCRLARRTDSARARNFITDALGSTLALTDSPGTVQTQYTYEPFGKTTVSGQANTSTFQYTGRENDGTAVYYYRGRYYNPTLGRFISEDPNRLMSGDVNFYTYVYGDPTEYRDPYGTDRLLGAAIGAAYGGIYGALGARMEGGTTRDVVKGVLPREPASALSRALSIRQWASVRSPLEVVFPLPVEIWPHKNVTETGPRSRIAPAARWRPGPADAKTANIQMGSE